MPLVSVIIPCYNEEATIQLLLEAVYNQSFPRQEMEVIIADGLSTDQTRQAIESFQESHPDLTLHLIPNPRRSIPVGLNLAIQAAQGDTIIRLDAHSAPHPDYVANCIAILEKEMGDNVGGVWEIKPGGPGWLAKGIAAAAAHPLGAGDAFYRTGSRARSVDTVPFGAFKRALIEKIGGFDESLLTNEDYEFNARMRKSGGRVWLDPKIRSTYFARPTLISLARQYWRYGYWKAQMLMRYPDTLRWRQALPPVFVLTLLGFGLASAWFPLARLLLLLEAGTYLGLLLIAGIRQAMLDDDPLLAISMPMAVATMHLAWGSAFIWSLFPLHVASKTLS